MELNMEASEIRPGVRCLEYLEHDIRWSAKTGNTMCISKHEGSGAWASQYPVTARSSQLQLHVIEPSPMLLDTSRFRGLFRMAYFQRMFNPLKLETIDVHPWLCACIAWTGRRSSLYMSHRIDRSQEP